MHFAPDNIPPLSFLQAGCPSCHPTNSIKSLKVTLIVAFSVQWGEIFLHVMTVTFLHNSRKPPLRSWTWLYCLNYYYNYNCFMALWILSGTIWLSQYQNSKTKTNLDFLQQKTVSGSRISWAICKSAPGPRRITTPTPITHFLQAGCPSYLPTNSIKAVKANEKAFPMIHCPYKSNTFLLNNAPFKLMGWNSQTLLPFPCSMSTPI